ncbi:MAG: TonB-dependent receptor [Deltaproteobacteria bacterium]|nr:TonB-dependent receptor [Deltaproteobacteria bacterium]
MRFWSRTPVVVVVALLAAAPSLARTLEGTVREAGTRRPIPGAFVSLVGGESKGGLADMIKAAGGGPLPSSMTDDGTVETDDEGAFVLVLPDRRDGGFGGRVVLEIETPGYQRLVEAVNLRKDRASTNIDLYLVPTAIGETQVRERRSKEAHARGAHRIDGREVSELPGTYGDPAKAIENFPGMGRVLLSQGSLFVRGAAPNESAVFVDDYEIPDLYHFTGSTSVINAPFVESVELVPGAFSARYGRSTGGVITIKTKKLPTDDVHGLAKLDVIDSGAYVGVPLGPKIAFGASARRSYLDAIRGIQIAAAGTGDDVVLVPTYWDYQLKLDWDTAPGHELVVFAFGSGDRESYVADGAGDVDTYQRANDSDFHRLSLRYSHGVGSGVTHAMTMTLGYDRALLDEQNGLRFKDRQSADVQLRDEWTWRTTSLGARPTKIIAGIDTTARSDGWVFGGFLADTGVRELPTPDVDGGVRDRRATMSAARATGAAYLEATLEPIDGVTLVPGLRLDGMVLDGADGPESHASLEPRVAGTWQVTDGPWGSLLRAGAGASSRPPDSDEVAAAKNAGLSLRPQRALSIQGGVEQSLGEGLVLSTTIYQVWRDGLTTKARDFPVPDRTGTTAVIGGGSGESIGTEVLLRFTLPQQAFAWLTYSLAKHTRFDDDVAGDTLTVSYPRPSPADTTHLLGVVGQVQLPWNLRAGARYRIATGMPDDAVADGIFNADSGRYEPRFVPKGTARFPFFQALDLRVDWTTVFDWFELTAYADIVNVLNLRAQESTDYNFDFSKSEPHLGLPTIPAVGVKATF